jgi:OmpA-OmpF porin, OOP family
MTTTPPSHRPFRNGVRRYAALLAVGPALAACSGYPYSSGNPQGLATYDAPVTADENGPAYNAPMRGNYIVADWNLGSEQRAAEADRPATASLTGARIPATFLQSLDSDYASFASALYSPQQQWADADYFSRKGLVASNGDAVLPEDSRNWLIPNNFRPMLDDARVRLVSDLDAGGRDNAPALAARAQVSYDCWVEKMETTWWTAENGKCRTQFETALNRLEHGSAQTAAAAPPANAEYRYQVYFDFDKFYLTPEAHQVVASVAERLRSEPGLRVDLVGKADRTGTDPYNMRLSERRADAVRAELVTDGVATNHIVITWVGERELPVPTPDGVREPRNRVVEVTTLGPDQAVSQR